MAGFSLVELIVSMGIASLLLLGISIFFSDSLKNTFTAQEKVQATQSQFTLSAILQEKLTEVKAALNPFQNNELIALNQEGLPAGQAGATPFTYIGKIADQNGKIRLVFKDTFTFNAIKAIGVSQVLGNSGAGSLKIIGGNVILNKLPENFAGFTKKGTDFYVAVPHENKIIRCPDNAINCQRDDLSLTLDGKPYELSSPMDIETDGMNLLFVSDAGHGKVLKIDLSNNNAVTVLSSDFQFPTGLAYYAAKNVLFVSDTGANQVKKIDLVNPNQKPAVIAGLSGQGCGPSAQYCSLKSPMGIFVDPNLMNPALYIADSGNNRVLKVSDAGKPTEVTFQFLSKSPPTALKKITVSFPNGINSAAAKLMDQMAPPYNDLQYLNKYGTVVTGPGSLEYQLFTTLAEDTAATNACGELVCGKNKIRVVSVDLPLNDAGKKILLGSDANNFFTVAKGARQFELTLDHDFAADHSAGEEVIAASVVSDKDQNGQPALITFRITNLNTQNVTEPYPLIEIQGYDLNGQSAFKRYHGMRVGDGTLGTADDVITVIAWNDANGVGQNLKQDDITQKALVTPLRFPTGASNAFFANTGQSVIAKRNDNNEEIFTPISGAWSLFDYMSDFELEDNMKDGLTFQKLNNGKLLQMKLKAKTSENEVQTYQLSTPLGG